ncbi:benzoate 1,2-dioxygenase electron transfer component BenC [uncultured Amphritea sp.]|uniref:benzoate 1,2-dioxygenase electron transfer component BenC n=1 Tax=uncultured Amphritea sp. TaxID=981605 RepID=UPI0025FAD76F|nr:benzoate 1,2-dioxygenase electron transfer component BenC [uncultured Amphritea sp.]
MSYKIALNFEDGVTRFIECNEGELVADAAYRQRVNIPLDCRDGACGTCKCHAESGKYTLEDYIEDALSDEEAEQGQVLTCRMVPTSDCVVSVPVSSKVCKTVTETYAVELSTINRHSDTAIGFSVKGDTLANLHFLPGQYVNIKVPGSDETRAYSFSSLVSDANEVSFLIRVIPDGRMSSYMRDTAQVGESLEISGPFGSFYLRDMNRRALFLAGGTGLAPFTAMLEKMQRDGLEYPVHLIYGVTNDIDLVEVDRLERLAAALPLFSYTTCVASPESEHPAKGYVTHYIEAEHLCDGDVDIYLCGPPPMVDAVNHYFSEKGITPASFHYEKFS